MYSLSFFFFFWKLLFLPTSSSNFYNGDVQTNPKGNLHLTFFKGIPEAGCLSSSFTILTTDNRLQLVSKIGFMSWNRRSRQYGFSIRCILAKGLYLKQLSLESSQIESGVSKLLTFFHRAAMKLMQRSPLPRKDQKWLECLFLIYKVVSVSVDISCTPFLPWSYMCIYDAELWQSMLGGNIKAGYFLKVWSDTNILVLSSNYPQQTFLQQHPILM